MQLRKMLASAVLLVSTLLGVDSIGSLAEEKFDLKDFPIPIGLIRPAIPEGNAVTKSKVELGRMLFNDKRLSIDSSVSCGSCHVDAASFGDGKKTSVGSRGQLASRNTPTVLNVAYFSSFNWDGAAKSLEEQAEFALLNQKEMGGSRETILQLFLSDAVYSDLFRKAFGSVSFRNGVAAIATYERTLLHADSPFDRYLFCGDAAALSETAKRGYKVFLDKGNCIVCHQIQHWSLHPFGPDEALFTDNRFHNLGIGFDQQTIDPGRYAITHEPDDFAAFKTPSLRNVALTSPYMHDGSLATLESVVEFYAKGGVPNKNKDPGIQRLRLTTEDKAALVEFLKSLTGSTRQTKRGDCKGEQK
jgi:cytochrome c peroxidase